MHLNLDGFNVRGAVRTTTEIGQVELDLVPAFVELHGHGADEGLDAGGALEVAGTESTADILIIQNGDFKGEVLVQVLDNHHQVRHLDSQRSLTWACDVVGGDV